MSRRRKKDALPRNSREKGTRERALATISLMRREHLPLKLAARVERIRAATVLRYAGSALRKSKGDYRVKASDRIPRSLNVIGPKGMRITRARGSRAASQIARYMNAVKAFVRTNDQSALRKFRGKRVPGATYAFVVSPTKLKRFADAGVLEIERLYLHVKGS
jgi:hypothetical protein